MLNEEVLKRVSLPTIESIESILLQVQLRWAVHVTRMEDIHGPKAVFFSELQEEKRDVGAPRKCYKDLMKRQPAQAGIKHQLWQQKPSDRDSWRSSVRKASRKLEAERHEAAREKDEGSGESEQHPQPKPSPVQSAVSLRIEMWTLQPPTSMQKLTITFPKSSSARNQSTLLCILTHSSQLHTHKWKISLVFGFLLIIQGKIQK